MVSEKTAFNINQIQGGSVYKRSVIHTQEDDKTANYIDGCRNSHKLTYFKNKCDVREL